MTVLEYDTFTAGAVDPSKWVPLQLPTPDGSMWSYGDPQAKVEAHGGIERDSAFRLTPIEIRIQKLRPPPRTPNL